MLFNAQELKEMLLRQGEFWRMPQICEQAIRIDGTMVEVLPCLVERCEGIGGRVATKVVPTAYEPILNVFSRDRSLDVVLFRRSPRGRRRWRVLEPSALQAEALVAYGLLRRFGGKEVRRAHEQTLRWLGVRMDADSRIGRR